MVVQELKIIKEKKITVILGDSSIVMAFFCASYMWFESYFSYSHYLSSKQKKYRKISMTGLMIRLTYMVFWPIFSSIYGMGNAASNYASQVWFSGSSQEACCFAKRVATLFCLFCMFFG